MLLYPNISNFSDISVQYPLQHAFIYVYVIRVRYIQQYCESINWEMQKNKFYFTFFISLNQHRPRQSRAFPPPRCHAAASWLCLLLLLLLSLVLGILCIGCRAEQAGGEQEECRKFTQHTYNNKNNNSGCKVYSSWPSCAHAMCPVRFASLLRSCKRKNMRKAIKT